MVGLPALSALNAIVLTAYPKAKKSRSKEEVVLEASFLEQAQSAATTILAALRPGDTLRIPNETYYVMGGIRGENLRDVTASVWTLSPRRAATWT